MTFDELIDELPNGLHDAALSDVEISYAKRMVVFHMTANVTEDASLPRERDLKIVIEEFAFFVIDVPDGSYPYRDRLPLTVDAGSGQPSTSAVEVPAFPDGASLQWIYVYQWNAFIRFAATACSFEWVSESRPIATLSQTS